MRNDSEHLHVFGYGLSLLIPYLVLARLSHGSPGFVWFLAGFIFILVLIARLAKVRPVYNAWIIAVQAAAFAFLVGQEASVVALGWVVLAVGIAAVTIINAAYLRPVYFLWMKAAHAIGRVLSTAVLIVLFLLVFGIIGIILRLMRKDPLHLRPKRSNGSYWAKREQEEFKPENYLRQF